MDRSCELQAMPIEFYKSELAAIGFYKLEMIGARWDEARSALFRSTRVQYDLYSVP